MVKNVFNEITAEKFSILKKETDIQVQGPKQDEPNRSTSRHTITKMAKVKERILKAGKEKQSYKREPP